MNDASLVNTAPESDPSETDLVSLLKKMQRQLNLLETKIDTLISQSQSKPFDPKTASEGRFRKRPFSKPPRAFDRPRAYGREAHESGPKDRDSAARHFYDRYSSGKKRPAHPKKKPYFSPRNGQE